MNVEELDLILKKQKNEYSIKSLEENFNTNNDLVNIKIHCHFAENDHKDKLNFKKIEKIIDSGIFLSKNKSSKKYELEIVSKGDFFLIYTHLNMFKIDKLDIIHIGIREDRGNNQEIIFDLKNINSEIKIKLHSMQEYKVENLLNISVVYSFKEEKILEFLFSELYEYIERKNSANYL